MADKADTRKQPKIVTYMGALYEKMSNEANEIGEEPVLIWQGKLIETCLSVGIPQGYYKKVVDTLRAMGCVEMITRGRRGNTPTTIALRFPPTLELYDEAIVKSGWDALTDAPSFDTVVAQLKDVKEQVGGFHIPSVLAEIHDRLSKLEQRVGVETATKVSDVPSQQSQQARKPQQ